MNTEIDKIRSNFFFSANSEAYQDAFLSWVILNYNSDENPDVKEFSKYFIEKLLNDFSDDTKITIDGDIELERQVHKSDINVIVNTDQGKHLIIIEDKVGSAIHSSNKKNKDDDDDDKYDTQLLKYFDLFLNDNKYTDYFLENRVHLFVYKNQYIDNFEKKQIEISNKGTLKYLNIFKDNLQSEIDDLRKKVYKKKKDGNKSADELNRDEKVKLLEIKKKTVKELIDKKIEFNWISMDSEDIYSLFDKYYSHPSVKNEKTHNALISEYYQMHKLKYDEYKRIDKSYKLTNNDGLFEVLWNDRSWLWEVLFYELTDKIFGTKDKINDGCNGGCVEVSHASSGYYWVWAFHSEHDLYSINIDARAIIKSILKKEALSISINMGNPIYGNEDVFNLKINEKNKPTNEAGVKKRSEHAIKIQNAVTENYKGNYTHKDKWINDIEKWNNDNKIDLKSKLNNTITQFDFDLSEHSVEKVADAIKEVLDFAEKYIYTIPIKK